MMQTMQRAVVLSGGQLGEWVHSFLHPDDLVIAADRGAWFAVRHGIRPHMAIGDFDSISPEQLAEISEISEQVNACDPVWKDLTDTEMAVEYALTCGVQELLILGATGTRLDHTIANVQLLEMTERQGVSAALIDANNEIRLATSHMTITRSGYQYVSLLPLTERVTGITLSGFRYPLQDAELVRGQTRGISNELTEPYGTIALSTGKLLVIQSKD